MQPQVSRAGEAAGQLDNTLIFLLSDNGATNIGRPNGTFHQPRQGIFGPDDIDEVLSRIDEIGTPMSSNLYPAGWGQLGNTPLRPLCNGQAKGSVTRTPALSKSWVFRVATIRP